MVYSWTLTKLLLALISDHVAWSQLCHANRLCRRPHSEPGKGKTVSNHGEHGRNRYANLGRNKTGIDPKDHPRHHDYEYQRQYDLVLISNLYHVLHPVKKPCLELETPRLPLAGPS